MSAFLDQMLDNASGERGLTAVADDRTRHSWRDIHNRAASMAGAFARLGVGHRSCLAILAGQPVEVAALAQAGWMRGASLTMLHHPTIRIGRRAWLIDTATAASMIDASMIVVGDPFGAATEPLRALGHIVVTVDELRGAPAVAPAAVDEDAVAMRQLTSGSTATPKAAEITHANLAASILAMAAAVEVDAANDVMVSWLPLSHDMGMVGFLAAPMQLGIGLVATTPERFLRRPGLWAELVTTYHATITAGPDFSYSLLARALTNAGDDAYDLSSLRVALNGAEPIDLLGIERMILAGRRFGLSAAAITPAYGMAEATLAISFGSIHEAPRVDVSDPDESGPSETTPDPSPRRAVVSVGRPVAGIDVRIIGEDGVELGSRRIGAIHVRGPMVSRGYTTAGGWLSAQDDRAWLDTGDLGYRDEHGELYVLGRSKDTIILAGNNIYPTDIERAATGVPGVREGNAVAVRIDPGRARESFAVIAESTDSSEPDLVRRIQGDVTTAVRTAVGYSPRHVLIVSPGTLPKTPSGKLRRTAAAELLTASVTRRSTAP